jgi:hypothetical protein
MSLADEMKRFAKKVFGFTDQQLWGPSQFRNDVDPHFSDPDEWDRAEDRLFEHGRDWCRFLFARGDGNDEERSAEAYWALITWFDNLADEYGVYWGQENKLSPRLVLQTIGTEWGRRQDEQVWVRATLNIAQQALDLRRYSRENGLSTIVASLVATVDDVPYTRPAGIVIPDCRFRNEVDGVHAVGGKLIRVKRPGAEKATVGIAGHASEVEQDSIPDTDLDHIFISPEGVGNMYIALAALIPPILRSNS